MIEATVATTVGIVTTNEESEAFLWRFSSLTRMARTAAHMRRFIPNEGEPGMEPTMSRKSAKGHIAKKVDRKRRALLMRTGDYNCDPFAEEREVIPQTNASWRAMFK
ncbi:hypothetical protein Aduo_018977 [Ancylostoma duodenale]